MRNAIPMLLNAREEDSRDPLRLTGVVLTRDPPFRMRFRSNKSFVLKGSLRSLTLHPLAFAIGLIGTIVGIFFLLTPTLAELTEYPEENLSTYIIGLALLACSMSCTYIIMRSYFGIPVVRLDLKAQTIQIGNSLAYPLSRGTGKVEIRLHDTLVAIDRTPTKLVTVIIYTPDTIAVLASVHDAEEAKEYIASQAALNEVPVVTGRPFATRLKYYF